MYMTGDRTEREEINAAIHKARQMRAEAFASFFKSLKIWVAECVNAVESAQRTRATFNRLGHNFKTEVLPRA